MTEMDAPAAESEPRDDGRLRRMVNTIGLDNASLVLALAVVALAIVSQQPLFLTWQNLMNSLAQSIVIVGLMAIGQTVVIVGGGLDISVGSIASVASVTSAMAVVFGIAGIIPEGSMQVGLAVGIATGLVLGAVNGLVINILRVNPIIATLGTLAAFAGLAFLVAPDGRPVGVVAYPDFTWLGTGRVLADLPIPRLGGLWTGVPIIFVVLVCVALFAHVLMRYMDFGRLVYAIGGNPTAARLAGINLRRTRLAMYAFSGMCAGLAGVLLTARTTSGNPINGVGFELQAITAVFLGGAGTTGGTGTIMGTLLAFILVGTLNNGMNLLGIGTFYQRVALGLLLIGAVAIAQWRQQRAERGRASAAALGG